MNDCCCFCPGWYYYMDCNGDFWMPYEVPADSVATAPQGTSCGDECWCWEGCPQAASPGLLANPSQNERLTQPGP